jgi:hypothetical protein
MRLAFVIFMFLEISGYAVFVLNVIRMKLCRPMNNTKPRRRNAMWNSSGYMPINNPKKPIIRHLTSSYYLFSVEYETV